MSFSGYPEYKNSHTDFLGNVPAHWHIERLKHCAEVFPSNVDKKSVDGQIPVRLCNYTDVYYNEVIQHDAAFMQATATKDQVKRFELQKGDVVFTKDSESVDDIAIAAYVPKSMPGVIYGYHLSIARPKGSVVGKFLKRVFDSQAAKSYFAVSANGLTRVGLGQHAVDNAPIALPPLAEQSIIATFLDHETARIDALVEEQQRLIELLKEKRQAVITHAVTKGLDPDVPMKDSGVEWLGEVPEHWQVKPLRYLGKCQNGINIGAEAFGSGFPFVSYGDVYKNEVLPTSPKGLVQSSGQDREKYSIKKGDVLFTRTSETVEEIGFSSTCFKDIPSATFAGFLIRFRPVEGGISPSFSRYFFGNQRLREFFVKEMEIVTRASLGQDLLKRMNVPTPPVEEQIRIAQYLDAQTQKNDSLLDQAHAAIKLLAERRSAVIFEAVTGNIDVRGWNPTVRSVVSSKATQTEAV